MTMLVLISKFSLFIIAACCLLAISLPKIKLPVYLDLLLLIGAVVSGGMLFSEKYYFSADANVTFRAVMACVTAIVFYRTWERSYRK